MTLPRQAAHATYPGHNGSGWRRCSAIFAVLRRSLEKSCLRMLSRQALRAAPEEAPGWLFAAVPPRPGRAPLEAWLARVLHPRLAAGISLTFADAATRSDARWSAGKPAATQRLGLA